MPQNNSYVDPEGIIRDVHLETMFKDVVAGEEAQYMYDNFRVYTSYFYEGNIAGPTDTILQDTGLLLDWALQFGPVTIWLLEDVPTGEAGYLAENGLLYAGYIGAILDKDEPMAFGKTPRLTLMNCVIQLFRNLSRAILEQNPKDITH